MRAAAIVACCAMASSNATSAGPTPGRYVRDQNTGYLSLSPIGQGSLGFDIVSIGTNAHSCSLSGVIQGTVGLTKEDDGPRCKVRFTPAGSAVRVEPVTEEACRSYCGMRASFEGSYRIPPPRCTDGGRQAQRDSALAAYRRKDFAEAGAALQDLGARCKDFIGWKEMDSLRNDLALALYHQGKPAECLAMLKETVAGTVDNEEALKAGAGGVSVAPADYDDYIGVATATWFNKALCAKALAGKR